jgi:hypothetical protein
MKSLGSAATGKYTSILLKEQTQKSRANAATPVVATVSIMRSGGKQSSDVMKSSRAEIVPTSQAS